MAKNNNKTIYELSNEITEVRLNKFNNTTSNKLLNTTKIDRTSRVILAQMLIDYLSSKFNIPSPRVYVTDTPRKQRGNAQIYGYYMPNAMTITIYNTTAKTNKTVAIKTFYNTLIHEFMHHYDYTVLKFTVSPHTSGFYKRITDIENKLK